MPIGSIDSFVVLNVVETIAYTENAPAFAGKLGHGRPFQFGGVMVAIEHIAFFHEATGDSEFHIVLSSGISASLVRGAGCGSFWYAV